MVLPSEAPIIESDVEQSKQVLLKEKSGGEPTFPT